MTSVSAERRQAVWPWLVMPLTVLALYYVLEHFRQMPDRAPISPASQTTTDPGDQ